MSNANLSSSSGGIAENSLGGTYTTPNNPVNTATRHSDSAPYEGTGTSKYGNNVESTTSGTAGEQGTSLGDEVKGVAAKIHGAGEKIRGTFNKGVDDTFDGGAGSARDARVARDGDSEISSGKFSTSAKQREGALPGGVYEKEHRHGQMEDLNRE